MRRVVVDAATVLSWFDPSGAAQRRDYEAGEFAAMAPRRLPADLLAAISQRSQSSAERLARIAGELPHIGIGLQDPPLPLLAAWIGRGLDPNLAPYAALAEHLDVRLEAGEPVLRERAAGLIGG